MTNNDKLELLRRAVSEAGSQAKVAAKLGYSSATVSQLLSGSYNGSSDTVLTRVFEVYGGQVVGCPILGDIALCRCVDERRRPFSATNPRRVRMYRACKGCGNNTDTLSNKDKTDPLKEV